VLLIALGTLMMLAVAAPRAWVRRAGAPDQAPAGSWYQR